MDDNTQPDDFTSIADTPDEGTLDRVQLLSWAMLDEEISEGEVTQLQELLASDPAARER